MNLKEAKGKLFEIEVRYKKTEAMSLVHDKIILEEK